MTPVQLAERRKTLGLSQAQLAAHLGVHRQTVSQWERGEQAITHPLLLDAAIWAIERGWQPRTEG